MYTPTAPGSVYLEPPHALAHIHREGEREDERESTCTKGSSGSERKRGATTEEKVERKRGREAVEEERRFPFMFSDAPLPLFMPSVATKGAGRRDMRYSLSLTPSSALLLRPVETAAACRPGTFVFSSFWSRCALSQTERQCPSENARLERRTLKSQSCIDERTRCPDGDN